MTIKAIIRSVELSSLEPSEEGRVRLVKDGLRLLEPVNGFGLLSPKVLQVGWAGSPEKVFFISVGKGSERNTLGGLCHKGAFVGREQELDALDSAFVEYSAEHWSQTINLLIKLF